MPARRSPPRRPSSRTNAEAVITILTDAAAIDAVYNGPSGLLSGDVRGKLFIEMSTVQPPTAVALAEKVRAKGAAWSNARSAARPGRRGRASCIGLMGAEPADAARAQADPRSALPAARALRAGRLRRGHEAHHQHAADDLLAGARRGAGALPAARARSRRGSWTCSPTRRAAPTCSRCAGPAIASDAQGRRWRPASPSTSTARSRTCAPCWRKARRAASSCRSSRRRWPATRRRSARSRAPPKSRPSRSTGRTARKP